MPKFEVTIRRDIKEIIEADSLEEACQKATKKYPEKWRSVTAVTAMDKEEERCD